MGQPDLTDITTLPGFAEIESGCPACGEPIDYCPGHGEIGDPAGQAILSAHDKGEHGECSPYADCQLEIARTYLDETHVCDLTTCEVTAAMRLGFIRIAASLADPTTDTEYTGPFPNMHGGIIWPEDDAWSAITRTRPQCSSCEAIMYVPITEGLHQCDNCLAEIEIDMVDIERGRIWAGDYHPGQMSGAYAFMSSGTVTPAGIDYFHRILGRGAPDDDPDDQTIFEHWAILYSMGAILDTHLDWT